MSADFISIDPGWKNCGVIVGHWKETTEFTIHVALLAHFTKNIEPSNKSDHYEIIRLIDEQFCPILNQHKNITTAYMEHQYFNPYQMSNPSQIKSIIEMQVLQMHLFWWLHSKNIHVIFVNSSACKRGLGLATGNYYQNKKKVIEFIQKIGLKLNIHHEADALAIVHWSLLDYYSTIWDCHKNDITINWT